MKNQLLLLAALLIAFYANAQQRIDGSFEFQTDPAKKYSIYIPSGYDANTPHTLILGLHPFNTSRWDAESWCDTLVDFAEMNNLLLVCPDGGLDGKIDDPIDTAFTTVLLDSMFLWYNVNSNNVFAMGFSWGGKTVYTYGLNHISRFRGFMPIGAAINGAGEISGMEQNANGHPFYLVHGGSDSPATRFTPLKNALEANDGCVNSLLMSGVGHTIDFPNRNQILTDAFQWLDSVTCVETTATIDFDKNKIMRFFPNPAQPGELIRVEIPSDWSGKIWLQVTDLDGKILQEKRFSELSFDENQISFLLKKYPTGTYFLSAKNEEGDFSTTKIQIIQ